MPLSSVSSMSRHALRLPRQERLEDPLALREVLLRGGDVAPAVHRAAGDALEDHDLAGARCCQRRKHEVLADGRDQVERDGRVLRAWGHPGHVREREGALRRAVRGARRVALEELRDLALAGGDDHEVVLARVGLEVGNGRVVQDELPALPLERLHPAGHLQALVDRLGRPLEPRRPVDRLSARPGPGDDQRDPVDVGTLVGPEVDAELALVLERGVEHALARHHAAVADVVRRPIRDDGDLVPVLDEAKGELQAGLAGTDDEEARHSGSPTP